MAEHENFVYLTNKQINVLADAYGRAVNRTIQYLDDNNIRSYHLPQDIFQKYLKEEQEQICKNHLTQFKECV